MTHPAIHQYLGALGRRAKLRHSKVVVAAVASDWAGGW